MQTHPLQRFAVGETVAVEIDATQCSVFRAAARRCNVMNARILDENEEPQHEQARLACRPSFAARSTGPTRATSPPVPVGESTPAIRPGPPARILFVHGSSMASQPTFDLQVPGRADSSVMDFFAARGYDTWCVDMEGYGRSTKKRDNNAPIAHGADDCFAAASYIEKLRGKRPLLVYGISSGALRAALFAQRHPEMVARLALDAMVWTGEGSPTLAERSKRLPEFRAKNRRPIDRKFVRSIFERDHPGTADDAVIEAFADAILKLDDSVPTGTYVDMCANLPVCDPEKITAADPDHARRIRRHRQLRRTW